MTENGVVSRLGTELFRALPAQFLALCVLNVAFLAVVFWHESRTTELRAAVLERIVDRCMGNAPPAGGAP